MTGWGLTTPQKMSIFSSMEPTQNTGRAVKPMSFEATWERVNRVATSSISGAAGGALLGSGFGGLTGGIVGAVAGFTINAIISSTSV